MAEVINQTPLRFPHLPRFHVTAFAVAWVAGASTRTRIPVYYAREPGRLVGAAFTNSATLAAHGTDFRQFYIERARRGVYSTVMASRTTEVQGMVANVPFELDPAAGDADLRIEEGDVLVLTIGGGGALPAIDAGLFDCYVEKEN